MRHVLWTTGLFLLAATTGVAGAQPRDLPLAEGRRALTVQGQHYGTLSDDHPVTLRVRDVFKRLVRAAGRRPGLALEVHALDTPRIILEALRGGLVVISRGAADLAGGDDHALAFLLGHEIAHHVRDHYALLESLGVLGATATPGQVDSDQVVRAYHAIELDADRLGVLFAALAGYRAAAAEPVLMTLIERSGPDTFHPSPKKRAEGIRAKISEIVDHLELFHLGLFMLASGRPLDAAQVLEYFLSLFPSREVLSAVGVAYHREALRYAPVPPFRHMLVVDGASRAPTPKGAAHPAFARFLERALSYYTLAAEADPRYAPAQANLAAAHLDLGERELALGYANRALKHAPGLAAAHNNRGVAWALGRDWPQAEEDWLAAARLDPGLTQSAFNLARFYEARGRQAEAQRWAARVTASAPSRAVVPEAIGTLTPGMPFKAFADWLGEPGVRQIGIPRPGTSPLMLVLFPRRGLAMVVDNNTIEIVATLPGARVATASGLRLDDPLARVETVYGRPGALDGLQALNVWGYPARGLALLVLKDRVQAVWTGRVATQPATNERPR